MKSSYLFVLILLFLAPSLLFSQLGMSFSYCNRHAISFDLLYGITHRIHMGGSWQANGQKNTVVTERKENYGLTEIGDGDFFELFDLGYSGLIKKRVSIHLETSFGRRRFFTNYKDNRFNDKGYSLVRKSEQITGVGLYIGCIIKNGIEPYIGMHTIKKTVLGVRWSYRPARTK